MYFYKSRISRLGTFSKSRKSSHAEVHNPCILHPNLDNSLPNFQKWYVDEDAVICTRSCRDTPSDSDGDGYSDGVEDNSFTDPGDPNDHPYYGGWPIDSCRFDIEPTGSWGEGEIVNNITLMDQYGENLKIHDFCNHVVLFEHAGFG